MLNFHPHPSGRLSLGVAIALLSACGGDKADPSTPGAVYKIGDLVGSLEVAGSVDLSASDSQVFACQGETGVGMIRVSDPTAPRLADTYSTIEACEAVAAAGGWLYIAAGSSGFSVRHPGNGYTKGEYLPDYQVTRFYIDLGADEAWLTGPLQDELGEPTTDTVLERIDTRTAADMRSEARTELTGVAPAALTQNSESLFLADEAGSLHVFDNELDLETTWSPTDQSLLSRDAVPAGMAIVGDALYLPLGSPGLVILDVDDPSAPTLIGTWSDGAAVHDVLTVDDRVFVASEGSLAQLDASDPFNLVTLATTEFEGGGIPTGIGMADEHAFVVDDSTLWVVYAPMGD